MGRGGLVQRAPDFWAGLAQFLPSHQGRCQASNEGARGQRLG